ncbi:hypothetical protein EV421DRAFT_2037831 [Armillaria borealis]|uniref:Uncharacterized protein n=1 Tax=Armillaria borealis TaxID=47425 RepID=A0AA39J961_9AGAR|nr:hypothetical protein EV421DRAFT_2037831 [Armillaria borealis]
MEKGRYSHVQFIFPTRVGPEADCPYQWGQAQNTPQVVVYTIRAIIGPGRRI